MIVSKDEIGKYLNRNLDIRSLALKPKTLETFISFEQRLKESGQLLRSNGNGNERISAIDYLFIRHQQDGESVERLSKVVGISGDTLSKVFDLLSLPRVNREEALKLNEKLGKGIFGASDEQRRQWCTAAGKIAGRIVAEQHKGALGATAEQHKEWSTRGGHAAYKLKKGIHGASSEQRRERSSKAGKKSVELHKGVHGATAEQRTNWTSKAGRVSGRIAVEQKTGIHGATSKLRSEWGSKGAKISGIRPGEMASNMGKVGGTNTFSNKTGVHDPNTRNSYLPTFHGFRKDIGFDSRSMWEANLARILKHLNFKIEPHVDFNLNIPGELKGIFKSDNTNITSDFSAISTKGRHYYYEILARPYDRPVDKAKLDLLRKQLPENAKLIVITEKRYAALENAFADRVASDSRFIGWETTKDNISTSPEKWLRR